MSINAQGNLFATSEKSSVVVFDFETTGMSPAQGDCVIEVGAVRLEEGRIVDQFQALINPGVRLDPFVSDLTGISDAMLAEAPAASEVIYAFKQFIGASPLVAHNASFDKRFLMAEFDRYGYQCHSAIGCSLLVARRIFPEAPDHKLGTLVNYLDLPTVKRFHRALADASMTAELWTRLASELCERYDFTSVPFDLMHRLGSVPQTKVCNFLHKEAQNQGQNWTC